MSVVATDSYKFCGSEPYIAMAAHSPKPKSRFSIMKTLPILALGAAATALPSAIDLSPRASISKVDGLKFNIDGVTKCKSIDR